MIKVLIVEDENIVRLGLSTMLDWQLYGFCIAGLFKNGREALDYLKENEADIVITDIRMPVMDGEELVKQIREAGYDVEIIILSNFDDFQIVKNCFKRGITDYVLKQNIEPASFLTLLHEAVGRRKKNTEKKETPDALTEQKEFFWALRENAFDLTVPEVQNRYQKLIGQLENKQFFAVRILLLEEGKKLCKSRNRRSPAVMESIRERSAYFFEGTQILNTEENYLVFLWGAEKREADVESNLLHWINHMETMLKEYFNLDMKIGLSNKRVNLANLKGACELAQKSMDGLFYCPEKKVFFYEEQVTEWKDETDFFRHSKEIRLCLEFNNFLALKKSLEGLFAQAEKEKIILPNNICLFVSKVLNDINYFLIEHTKIKLSDLINDWEEEAQTYAFSIQSIVAFLFAAIDKVVDYLNTYENNYELVARVKRIIQKQYKEGLSLQYLAEVLNVNPMYLSTLFKKQTGSTYIHYLTNYRVEKAIELLRTTNLSVEKIAEETGYPNANYFVKVFKKTTGTTISAFRKNGIGSEKTE